MAAAQCFDHHAAVVEYAKAGSAIARGMMESAYGNEGTAPCTGHDPFGGLEAAPDDAGRRLVHSAEVGRVTTVQHSSPVLGTALYEFDMGAAVEQHQFIDAGLRGIELCDLGPQTALVEFPEECAIPVRTEGVSARKAVAAQMLTQGHGGLRFLVNGDLPATAAAAAYHKPRRGKAAGLLPWHPGRRFKDNARPAIDLKEATHLAMAQYIYTMNRVSKIVPPKRTILRDISLSFFPGAKIGVLGLNGSGKSTLLRIMAGIDTNIDGEARAQTGIRVGFLTQEPGLDPSKDVRGNVMEGVGETYQLVQRFNQISEAFAEPMDDEQMNKLLEEQAKLQDAIDAAGGWELERKLEIAADALRLPPWDAKIEQLSGGEKRRVALCRLLLSQPDMLLLDEPTNHLDAESVAWLERYLEEYPSTVIAVTHDRYFLDNVAQWILELDRGHGIPYQGNYSSWLEQKGKRLALEEREQEALRKTLERELDWVRANPKARQAKSKARLARYEELASKEFQERNETNEIYIPPGPRLGDLVIEAKNLRKSFGDNLLIDNLSFSLPPGGIVGIIGPNGAGKTTLFRMLTGAESADSGEFRIGPTVKLAYVDQSRQALDDKKSVWAEISGGQDIIRVDNYETPSRAYVGRFNFKGSQQQQLIGELSGGERNRVHLAKVLKGGGNVLLLDEPTNDLDVETLRALEEALVNFPGCAAVISHDRWFLDRIATHILAFEGNSEVVWFEGNYQEYAADLRSRRGEEAAAPHRLRYKRLTG